MNISKNKKIKSIILILLVIFAISLGLKIYEFNFKFKTELKSNNKEVVIIELYSKDEKKISYIVEYKKSKFLLNLYIENNKEINFRYGEVYKVNTKITIPKPLNNPLEFNYKRYLNSNNMVGIMSTYKCDKIDKRGGNIVFSFIYSLKEKIDVKISNILPPKEAELFKSIIYGNDILLDNDLDNTFKETGMSHLISVSGLNVTILVIILSKIIQLKNKRITKVINITLILIFLFLCAVKVSLLRASIMAIIGVILKDKYDISVLKRLIYALIVIVIINPYYVFNVGLILSFMATLGIVLLQNEIFSFLDIKLIYRA